MPQCCLYATASSHSRHNNRPIRQQNDKKHLSHRPLDRLRKTAEPERDRRGPKFLSLQRSDLYVIKGRHEIGGDLSHLLFCYRIGRILFTASKDVLKSTAIFGSASVTK
jgi:hypothetical protein